MCSGCVRYTYAFFAHYVLSMMYCLKIYMDVLCMVQPQNFSENLKAAPTWHRHKLVSVRKDKFSGQFRFALVCTSLILLL